MPAKDLYVVAKQDGIAANGRWWMIPVKAFVCPLLPLVHFAIDIIFRVLREYSHVAAWCDARLLIHSIFPALLLPTERCPGSLSCLPRILDLLAKLLLEVLGQHIWRTSFDNLAYLGIETIAAEARQASHAGQHDIDDKPFDVIVCTLRHDEVSN